MSGADAGAGGRGRGDEILRTLAQVVVVRSPSFLQLLYRIDDLPSFVIMLGSSNIVHDAPPTPFENSIAGQGETLPPS